MVPAAAQAGTVTLAMIFAPPAAPESLWLVIVAVAPPPETVSCGLDPKYEPLRVTEVVTPAVKESGSTEVTDGVGSPTVKFVTPLKKVPARLQLSPTDHPPVVAVRPIV